MKKKTDGCTIYVGSIEWTSINVGWFNKLLASPAGQRLRYVSDHNNWSGGLHEQWLGQVGGKEKPMLDRWGDFYKANYVWSSEMKKKFAAKVVDEHKPE